MNNYIENNFDVICYLAYNLVRIIITFGFYSAFFKAKEGMRIQKIGVMLAYFAIDSVCYILWSIPILNLIITIFFLYTFTFFYECKLYNKILFIICLLSLSMIIEGGVYFYISTIIGARGSRSLYISYVFTNLSLLTILLLIKQLFNSRLTNWLRLKHLIILLPIPAGLIYLASPYLKSYNFTIYNAVAILIIIVIDLLVFYFYYEITSYYGESFEKEIIEKENMYYKNQLDVIKESNKMVDKIRHDYKNHIVTIRALFEENNKEKAIEYANKILGEMYKKVIVNTGNTVIDSLLNYKLRDYKEKNIELKTEIFVPEKLFVEDYDLNIIIGNLIDNALRGIEGSRDRELEIIIKYVDNALFIRVNNTFDGEYVRSKDKYITTKKNKKMHGYGISNIEGAVKEYKGNMEIEVKDNRFSVSIELYRG